MALAALLCFVHVFEQAINCVNPGWALIWHTFISSQVRVPSNFVTLVTPMSCSMDANSSLLPSLRLTGEGSHSARPSFAGKRSNRKTTAVQADEVDVVVEGTKEGANVAVTQKKRRARAANKGPVYGQLLKAASSSWASAHISAAVLVCQQRHAG